MTTNYSIDYLNTLTVPELHNLAKNYLDFNTSQMERELKVPRETTRNIKDGTSLKHTNVVKNYLVDFLLKDNHLKYDPNEKFNLKSLFKKANKIRRVTHSDITHATGCARTTVSSAINSNGKGKSAFKIKRYLEIIISSGVHAVVDNKSYNDLTNFELYNIARREYGISLREISKNTKIPYNSIYSSFDTHYSKYSLSLRKYLIDFLNDSTNNIKESDLGLLFEEANKYEKVTDARIASDLGCSHSTAYVCRVGNGKTKTALRIKEYLENIINKHKPLEDIAHKEQKKEETMTTHYNMNYLENLTKTELFDLAKNKFGLTYAEMERHLSIPEGGARYAIKAEHSKYGSDIKKYLVEFLLEKDLKETQEVFDSLFEKANLTNKEVAEALNISLSTVSLSRQGKTKGEAAYKIKEFLENVIEHQNKMVSEILYEYYGIPKESEYYDPQEESKEQETMTEETLTDTKEMKTYDEFLNFINTQKELPIVKKALEETLKENQNLDKILAKEEFITIETAQELNEKLFANEYTEEEILDFENQYFGTTDNDSLKDKIKSFVEKHNLSLETALKLLQISEEDYKKMLEGADKVSNKTADKIYKAISAFDEFYRSEKTQDTINNTKNTFVTGFAIASAKSQTFLNKGLNKFADFLNKSADKIKNSNSENKED